MKLPTLLIGYAGTIRRVPYERPPPPSPKVSRLRVLPSLVGQRFGRLLVIGYAGLRASGSRWLCRCDCGGAKVVERANLRQRRTRSCGCLEAETRASKVRDALGRFEPSRSGNG